MEYQKDNKTLTNIVDWDDIHRIMQEYVNLEWHKESDESECPLDSRVLIKNSKADGAIVNNMKQNDLEGIFMEARDFKIYDKKTDEVLDYIRKGKEARKAIENTIIRIKSRLHELKSTGQGDTLEAQLLQEKSSRLSEVNDYYTILMKEAECRPI